jgi:uncharacterized protein YjdB
MVATCRTLRIGGTPTPGFTMASDKYTNLGAFTANISISFPTQPGQTVTLVSYNGGTTPDTCIKDVVLNMSGVGITTYDAQSTQIIYATLKVGGICCIGFDSCTSSNYISLTVIPIGNITFISTPEADAEIWLAPSGQTPVDQLLTTPNTISNLPAGTYDYIIKKTGYNDSSGSIDILENQTTIITVPMTPAEGCIYFDSTPQMAEIWIDGSVGTVIDTGFNTPRLICGLDLGSHVYKLILPGYDDIVDTAIIGIGSGSIVTKTLRQSPILTDIIISPMGPSVIIGGTQSFSAIPIDQYSDPFPATVTWGNSNSFVGNIDYNTGIFTALHTGTTIITATSGSVSRSTTVTVTQLVPVLTTIIVSPVTVSVVANNATIFTATTLDQFGNPISTTVLWSSSDTNIGTISQNGVFTAISPGTTTIMATSGTISGVAVANVTPAVPTEPPTLTRIVVTPLTENLLVGAGTVFVASTLDQFGDSIISPITWDSSDTNVGTIDQYGIFSALHTGKTIITATSGTIVGVALVNVVTTLPGQAGGLLGNINQAALILGMAMVGTVILSKPAQEIQIVQSEEGVRAKLKRLQKL